MGVIDRFKRDITKHRGKAAVLGILCATMVAMSIRAVVQLRPREAAATIAPVAAPMPSNTNAVKDNTIVAKESASGVKDSVSGVKDSASAKDNSSSAKDIATGADAEARIQESKDLWFHLREVTPTATEAKAAFTFDASYFPPPAAPVEIKAATTTIEAAATAIQPAPTPVVDEATARANRIQEEAKALVVKSTAASHGSIQAMAIVNQDLLKVGQKILGFEITAIRAREVEFTKEGVTTVVKMPDGQ